MFIKDMDAITKMNAGVSVVICCYNSAARLPQTLKHLQQQVVPEDFFWEIILVNNASKDDTVSCAKEIWNKAKPPNAVCRIVEEPKPGQMHARKTGAKEASYDCLVFCDDDNWLDKQYIFLAHQVMHTDKMIGAAGGQNVPVTDAHVYPEWFEAYKDKYAIGIPAPASGDVTYKGFVLGAGLITSRSLFLQLFAERYPSLLNGRNAEKLSTGDDFEYCKRLLLWDYKLFYDARLKLNHFIPKERLTIQYRDRLMEGIAAAGKVLHIYDLALQTKQKIGNKNKFRLFILAPGRILFAKLGLSTRNLKDEQLKFYYASPFVLHAGTAKAIIKKILNRK